MLFVITSIMLLWMKNMLQSSWRVRTNLLAVKRLFLLVQLQDMIDVAVSRMPPQRKRIYMMSRVEGMSNQEIATKLKINKRTVENHLTAALADIRKVIQLCLLFLC